MEQYITTNKQFFLKKQKKWLYKLRIVKGGTP